MANQTSRAAHWVIVAVVGVAVAIVGVALALSWANRERPAAHPPFLKPDPIATPSEGAGSASWVQGAGLPDSKDPENPGTRFALRLSAPRRGEVGATLYGVAGLRTLGSELGYDYRNDGTCTKNSPAIVVTWTDGQSDSYGCATGRRDPAPQDPERWTRVRFTSRPTNALGDPPPISDIRLVFNVPLKSVVIDNFHLITHVIGWPGLSIYVADMGNNRIVRIDNWTDSGWIAKWSSFGSAGSGVGQFNAPRDVYVDARGRIYIADTGNHRIVRIDDMSGAGWTTLGTGTCSNVTGAFCSPYSVSVDGAGRIYVAETNFFGGTARVVRVNDITGAGWTQFGAPGSGVGEFAEPVAMRYDAAGRLYIADWFNGRVVRIDDMSGAGWQALSSSPCSLSGSTSLGGVQYLALDLSQRLYVAVLPGTLLRFNDISGAGCARAAPFDQVSEYSVNGVAVDSYNRIYTTDGLPWGNHRIRRMRDMTGAGWITFGSRGNGVRQFEQPQGIAVVGAEPSPFPFPGP